MCGCVGRVALEGHVAVAASYIKSLLVVEMVLLIAYNHAAAAADVDDSNLPSLGEIVCPQDLGSAEQKLFLYGNCSTCDDAVEHRVDHINLVGNHHVFKEILLAYALGVVMLGVEVAGRLAYCAVDFCHIGTPQ